MFRQPGDDSREKKRKSETPISALMSLAGYQKTVDILPSHSESERHQCHPDSQQMLPSAPGKRR